MSATDELRKLLDERGIEWRSELKGLPFFGVTFVGDWSFCEYATGELSATCKPVLTPEQAIAVTLGSGSCEMEPSFTVPSRLDFMQEYRCTECNEYAYLQVATDDDALRFCPNCGREVVEL